MYNDKDNIKRVKSIIHDLDQSDCNWRQYVKDNDESNIVHIAQFREYITNLLFAIRNCIKSNDPDEKDLIYDMMHDDSLTDGLMEQAEKLLIHYRAMAPVRMLAKNNSQLCEDFFKDVMENYVCRWSVNFLNHFQYYHFSDSEEMLKAMESLDVLSNYYVGKSFSSEMIRSDFSDETGLSGSICDYYAVLINHGYQDIKLNQILQKVESLEMKMEERFKAGAVGK